MIDRATKEYRKQSYDRKRQDKLARRSPVARDLLTLKYRQRIRNVAPEKGGARNFMRELIYVEA